MVPLILAVLALFVVQTLLPASIRYLMAGAGTAKRLAVALGPRDQEPEMPRLGARAQRALANMQEAIPVFLALALLNVIVGTSRGLPTQGAVVFLTARTLYVPAYLAGVFGIRSAVWVVSWVGLGLMIAGLTSAH